MNKLKISFVEYLQSFASVKQIVVTVAERNNFKLLFSAGIVLPLGIRIYIFVE